MTTADQVPPTYQPPESKHRLEVLTEKLQAGHGLRGRLGVLRALSRERWSDTEQRDVIAVPMAELGGERIYIRPQTSDLSNATVYLAHGIHLPPPQVTDPRRIVELGTNMGAGLTYLAFRYPEARLFGVEPDPTSMAVAALNTARFGNRVRLARAAVWHEKGDIVVERDIESGAHGFRARSARPDDDPAERIPALSIDAVLEEAFPGEEIDYMHVTIEGSEPAVFEAGGQWPERVRSLRVEAHPYLDYPVEAAIAQLEALGYQAEAAPSPPAKWVFATRP